jgi:hypothetical protein
MQRIATSIVLIVGQMAMLLASPIYVCTSADGSQRIEFGECDCGESHHGSVRQVNPFADQPLAHEHRLAESPCHCEHQPLSEGTQLVSRSELESRGFLVISFADARIVQPGADYVSPAPSTSAAPLGHTPLIDRLSICLRC